MTLPSTIQHIVLLCILPVIVLPCVQQDVGAQQRTIAVISFENRSIVDHDAMEPLEQGLSDMLTTELSKIQRMTVCTRERVQSLIDESDSMKIDIADQHTARKLGKALDVEVLLNGSYSTLLNGKFRIDIRLVFTKTGGAITTEYEIGERDELYTMLQDLVRKITSDLGVQLSVGEEDRLEVTRDGNFSGYLKYAQALDVSLEGKKLQKQGKIPEAVQAFKTAKMMFQSAWRESGEYEPARARASDMSLLILKLQ